MPIVPNKDGMGIWAGNTYLGTVEPSLATPNRSTGTAPGGALLPLFSGEIVVLSTDGTMYKAMGLANTSWVKVT